MQQAKQYGSTMHDHACTFQAGIMIWHLVLLILENMCVHLAYHLVEFKGISFRCRVAYECRHGFTLFTLKFSH